MYMGDFNSYDGMYDNGMDMGYGDEFGLNSGMPYGRGYKPLRATNRNVQEAIAYQLGVDVMQLDFVKLDEMPNLNNWKHSCYMSGVTLMNVNQFIFEDGSNIIYGVCPFFPQCNKVHFYVDKGY